MSTSFQNNRPVVVDSELPAQNSTTNGSALISNGVTSSWMPLTAMIGTNGGQVTPNTLSAAMLPLQTGHANQFLQTNGAGTVSWAPIDLSGYATITYVTNTIQTAGKNSQGTKTVSTSLPSGTGTPGDIWYVV
jgi:hypothetical protein